jgi:hypothetical protein
MLQNIGGNIMPNVYYLKMKDAGQVARYEFVDPHPEKFPALVKGDLCFVRFENEYNPAALKRLWVFENFEDNPNGSRTAKFRPKWTDDNGDELFFDTLPVIGQFINLKLFKFDINLVMLTHRPSSRSFIPLELINPSDFSNQVSSKVVFDTYTSNPDNHRQVEIVDTFDANTGNLQLQKDALGIYTLITAGYIDTETISSKFDGNRPNRYRATLTPTSRVDARCKMYNYLQTGSVAYTLVGFYELFCIDLDAAYASTSKKATSSDLGADESLSTEATSDITADGTATRSTGSYIVTGGENLIIYGTPGCGKSHALNSRSEKISDDYKIRVTFHQDYTYTDFVGQILPVVYDDDKVKYEFVPGPFTLALHKAISNIDKQIVLIIEEINRGNAASIFGDLFQLLDRDDYGTSVYPLTNVQITDYLKKKIGYTSNTIRIPANLSLYATMNTGDQNVFTLDTAFKRRWKFEKLSNTFGKGDTHKDKCIPGINDVSWETFVCAINEHMIKDGTFDSEDKQLGKYFVTESQLVDNGIDEPDKTAQFAYKVLEYLWNDVAKFDRERWFNIADYKTLDSVIEAWKANKGKTVFHSDIQDKLVPTVKFAAAPLTEVEDDSTESADEYGEEE